MPSSTIDIKLKQVVEGGQQVTKATMDLRDLAAAADKVRRSMGGKSPFNAFMINAGAFSSAMQGLQSSLASLSEGYNSFDASMRAANTMAGKDSAGFAALKGEISELAKTIPLAREELANGLYQVISNGVPEDNWIEYLNASARSAVGGIADIGEVVKVTSTIIKNYGLAWDSAQEIQDKIQLTAKLGVTSFEQLAAALPSVTGQAAQLGVDFTELLAVMATLTGVTGNTAEVSTQLGSVLTALTKESSKSQKMAEAMGISFNAASIKAAGGLREFLNELDKTVTEYAAKTGQLRESIYSKLFGRAEALRLVNALTGELSDTFADKIGQMADSAGTIDAAFEDMSKSASSKAQLVKNAWAGVTDALGQAANAAKPIVTPLAQIGQATLGITAVGNAISGIGKQSVKAAASVRALGLAQASLRFGVVGAAIGALVGGYMLLTQRSREAAERQKALTAHLKELAKTYGDTRAAAAQYAAEEKRKAADLIGVATDETRSRKERNKAIKDLQDTFPGYFSNMTAEYTSIDALRSEYDRLTSAIVKNAEAKAARDKLAEIERKKIELEFDREDAETQLSDAKAKFSAYNTSLTALNRSNGIYAGTQGYAMLAASTTSKLKNDIENAQEKVDSIDQELEVLDAQADKLAAKIKSAGNDKKTATATPVIGGADTTNKGKTEAEDIIPDFDEVRTRAISNLAEYDKALEDMRKVRQHCSSDMIAQVDAEIKKLEDEKKAFQGIFAAKPVTLDDVTSRSLNSINEYNQAIADLQTIRDQAALDEIANIQAVIDKLKEERDMRLGITKKDKEERKKAEADKFAAIASGWNGVKGIASGLQGINKLTDENASAWDRATSAIDGMLGIYQGVSSVIEMLKTLGVVSTATATAQTAASAITTEAAQTDATAQLLDASAKAMNAHSWIPFVGIGLGAAAVGVMIAMLAGLPKFAEGGIAYGPTLGLFGEYAGASSNPEVVAPLDKLKELIGNGSTGMPAEIKVRLEGRDLVGAIKVNNNYYSRTS